MTLYERLGGAEAITAVVEGMYNKIFSDPELASFYTKTDRQCLLARQREFLTQATGGPSEYTGKSMVDSHKGRGITSADFDKVMAHIVATMTELHVPEDLQKEAGGHLESLRAECIE
jgi:hemoglobin